MDSALTHVVTIFMGFFAVMNPIANTPIFLAMTADDPEDIRRAVARKALLSAFAIIVIFTVSGRLIFEMFGIGLPAFRLTGGVLVLLLGFHMLQGQKSSLQHTEHTDAPKGYEGELAKAITPLAMPLLAGPGTIVTAINFASRGGLGAALVTVAVFFVLCLITYLSFVYGERFVRYLGHDGMSVITRLMGLILAVIGTQMVIDGVGAAVKAFHP